MSLGVPVVASSTKIDRFYFNESQVSFFKSGDPEDLAQALLQMLRDPELRRRQVANALKYVALHNWDSRRIAYLKLVDLLIAGDGGLDDLPPDPLDSRVSPQTFVDEAERESLTVRL
jgi:glycosyltransferase involved in cell wall biosynthesis